ncbi:MAG: GntR family transcriptional regulator [Propionibacteriaceae bacterium]|jgi:DNA-binding LacI/PurR family transcriptional regulator|nr:GntR family transcriptional regulator [Propionibacteriaceae bacterium]
MKTALYQQVYDELRQRITTGQIDVGARLPGLEALASSFGVSTITARKALDMLTADGLVMRRPRIGTLVVAATPTLAAVPTAGPSLIGCVMTNYDDTFGTALLSGVLEAADGRADVVVKRSLGDLVREERAISELVQLGARGMIVLPTSSHQVPTAVLALTAQKYPMVIVDRSFDAVPVSAVSSDNFGGAKLATEYLIGLGHHHIGWLAPPSAISTVEDRHAGYVRAQAEHGIAYLASQELTTLASVVPGAADGMENDIEQIDAFLAAHRDVTAYLASEYNLALLLATACRRRGLVVGTDVSVVCFDHPVTVFDPDHFIFSHVLQDQRALARSAVDQLFAEIATPGEVCKHVVPVELRLGGSTAPPGPRWP